MFVLTVMNRYGKWKVEDVTARERGRGLKREDSGATIRMIWHRENILWSEPMS